MASDSYKRAGQTIAQDAAIDHATGDAFASRNGSSRM
jgi:hypothetical protein